MSKYNNNGVKTYNFILCLDLYFITSLTFTKAALRIFSLWVALTLNVRISTITLLPLKSIISFFLTNMKKYVEVSTVFITKSVYALLSLTLRYKYSKYNAIYLIWQRSICIAFSASRELMLQYEVKDANKKYRLSSDSKQQRSTRFYLSMPTHWVLPVVNFQETLSRAERASI